MNNYYLRGPILNNNSIYIATTYTYTDSNGKSFTDLYFLVGTGSSYYFTSLITEPTAFIVISPNNNGTNISLQEKGTTTINFIAPTNITVSGNSYIVAGVSNSRSNFNVQTDMNVNPWGVFLAGIVYDTDSFSWILYPPTGRNPSNNCIPVGQSTTPVVISDFYVVPNLWYVSNQSCGALVNALESYTNEVAWFYRQRCGSATSDKFIQPVLRSVANVSSNIDIKQGYTRLSDCQAGVFYSYCPQNTDCSGTIASGCMGPCNENDLGCRVDTESKSFTCSNSPGPTILGLPLWVWILIIVGLIVFLLIIVGLILLLIFSQRHKK